MNFKIFSNKSISLLSAILMSFSIAPAPSAMASVGECINSHQRTKYIVEQEKRRTFETLHFYTEPADKSLISVEHIIKHRKTGKSTCVFLGSLKSRPFIKKIKRRDKLATGAVREGVGKSIVLGLVVGAVVFYASHVPVGSTMAAFERGMWTGVSGIGTALFSSPFTIYFTNQGKLQKQSAPYQILHGDAKENSISKVIDFLNDQFIESED